MDTRTMLFLFGCMGTRLGLVYIAYNFPQFLKTMGLLALVPAFGFMYIYFTGSRKTGPETFGDPIWWNNLRPVHGILWFTFAYMAINGMKDAWKVLLADVLLGFVAYLYHKKILG